MLQCLREAGCSWDGMVCELAAGGGHLGVLQWARGQRCPWGESTLTTARAAGHEHVVEWAHAHGAPRALFDVAGRRLRHP